MTPPHRTTPLLAALLLLISTAAGGEQRSFRDVLLEQHGRYPKMQVQDVYKLIFQAALGNEHLMSDTARIAGYLSEELRSVKADSAEPLVEYISPDSALVRINLRPFKAARLDPRSLVTAMVRTAAEYKRSKLLILKYWGQFEDLMQKKKLPFAVKETDKFYKKITKAHYPAMHHSDQYTKSYHPAYRVVLRTYADRLRESKP